MNLYIHIGTEKTGSSFLQQVCANNRNWLQQSGFYFPEAGLDEQRLRRGSISPGNARELASFIRECSWDRVDDWFSTRLGKAEELSCPKLLLSHELLFSQIGKPGVLEELEDCVTGVGIKKINYLLFIRDPVEQAISLYKHRGKNGQIGTFSEWIDSCYSTATELGDLIDRINTSTGSFDIRKYQDRTDALVEVFFGDWLGLDNPPVMPKGVVNPSLTLSEIEFLKSVAEVRAEDVRIFYQKFLAVPREEKALAEPLELAVRQEAANYLADFEMIWRHLDELLKDDGGLEIPRPCSTDVTERNSFSFSQAQLRAVTSSIRELHGGKYKLIRVFNKYLRPPLGKIKRALLS